ncbi:MAG TPA: F0F1 ATP synthase subunit A [Gemmatimonadaceae bacterium]|nr:F0F1 ATP synthase subunit A [Gemmatimonadaceae bacterium]
MTHTRFACVLAALLVASTLAPHAAHAQAPIAATRAASAEASRAETRSAVPATVDSSAVAAATEATSGTGALDPASVRQGELPVSVQGQREARQEHVDFITPHITDSRHIELPYWKSPWYREVSTWPEGATFCIVPFNPLYRGDACRFDATPTKHVWMLFLAGLLCAVTLISASRAHERHSRRTGAPKGFSAAIEAMVLYLRKDVVLDNVGPHGERFVSFILTLFFLILFANLLGLVPYASTATGNVAVTATLAIFTFIMIEITGMRELGPKGYLKTIFYWPDDMPVWGKLFMTLIMTPIEIASKIAKPFALAVRLLANMTAGHVVVLALIGLIFTFGTYWIAVVPVGAAVAIMLLELFVAFLQAYIFALLSAVFIGLIRQSAH